MQDFSLLRGATVVLPKEGACTFSTTVDVTQMDKEKPSLIRRVFQCCFSFRRANARATIAPLMLCHTLNTAPGMVASG